jgi:hypothetical protein
MLHAFLATGLHAHAQARRQQHIVTDPPPSLDTVGRRILGGQHTMVSTASVGLPTRLPKASSSSSTQQSNPTVYTVATVGGNDGPWPPYDSLDDDYKPPSLALADVYVSTGITLSGLTRSPHDISKPRFTTSTEDSTRFPHKQ